MLVSVISCDASHEHTEAMGVADSSEALKTHPDSPLIAREAKKRREPFKSSLQSILCVASHPVINNRDGSLLFSFRAEVIRDSQGLSVAVSVLDFIV